VNFFVENWTLIAAALVSGGLLAWPKITGATGGGVSTAEAVRLMNHEKAVVIDVCEPAEYAAGHVQGARNVPLGTVGGSKDLPSNKALPLIVVCASGMRSQRAVATLRKAGYEQALSLQGGLKAWREANLPIATGSR
jgi:rhodanese-related sulfurtransferase